MAHFTLKTARFWFSGPAAFHLASVDHQNPALATEGPATIIRFMTATAPNDSMTIFEKLRPSHYNNRHPFFQGPGAVQLDHVYMQSLFWQIKFQQRPYAEFWKASAPKCRMQPRQILKTVASTLKNRVPWLFQPPGALQLAQLTMLRLFRQVEFQQRSFVEFRTASALIDQMLARRLSRGRALQI